MMDKNNSREDLSDTSPCLSLDELIAYSENKLSGSHFEEIVEHIDHCSLCSEAMEGMRIIKDKQTIKPAIRSLKREIHARTTQSHVKKQNWKIYYAMAASLLLASSLLIYLFNQHPVENDIFSKYFKPYPNTIPIVRGEDSVSELKLAMIEYEFENYAETVLILQKLLQDDPENTTALFYSGISNLFLDKPAQAIEQLKKVIWSSENDFKTQAEWYLGLAFLKNEDFENARKTFNKIISEDHRYKQKSIEILELLNKNK